MIKRFVWLPGRRDFIRRNRRGEPPDVISSSHRAELAKGEANRPQFIGPLVLVCLLAALSPGFSASAAQQRTVILSTTTSTQDSGLLDVLIPLFEKQSAHTVKTISVGTGQALA